MMPKASLNCWMAEWEKESKMLAFLGMMALVVVPVGPERWTSWVKLVALAAALQCVCSGCIWLRWLALCHLMLVTVDGVVVVDCWPT